MDDLISVLYSIFSTRSTIACPETRTYDERAFEGGQNLSKGRTIVETAISCLPLTYSYQNI